MANYLIIGGDGKEYGPVTDADVRLWITEGRLNAQSLAKAESDAEFRPLAQFPEFAGAFMGQAADASTPPGTVAPVDWRQRDYELDIGDCLSHGWNLLKENFGTLTGAFLFVVAVAVAFMCLLNVFAMGVGQGLLHAPVAVRLGYSYCFTAVMSLVVGPSMGGLYLVYLKTIRGQMTGAGEMFAGFQKAFVQLFLGALVVSLIVNACRLPFDYVWQMKAGPLMDQVQNAHSDPAAFEKLLPQFGAVFVHTLPVRLVCAIPVTYLTVCWLFTLPLIIDKGMVFGTAMKTSFKMVNKHWWLVFGLTVVAGLVSAAGVLACCVGALFTIPLGLAVLMFAYETIFGAEKN